MKVVMFESLSRVGVGWSAMRGVGLGLGVGVGLAVDVGNGLGIGLGVWVGSGVGITVGISAGVELACAQPAVNNRLIITTRSHRLEVLTEMSVPK